jgi:hypothetical protein
MAVILQLSYLARDSGGHCSLRVEYGASVTLYARDARDEAYYISQVLCSVVS